MAITVSTGMDGVRAKRDRLLASTDHLVMPDSPLDEGMRLAWGTYRQKLRDITGQSLPVTWPAEPTEPEEVAPPVEAVTYSARIEEYRNDGETDGDLKRRLIREIDEKLNLISGGKANQKDRAKYETLHEMLYQLKDV